MSPARDPHAQFAELAVGYAMHALEPEDEATFIAHMPGCAECREAVEQWRTTSGHLAYGAGTEAPPAELRERLLAAIGHDETAVRPLDVSVLATAAESRLVSRSRTRRPVRSTGRLTYSVPVRALAAAAALTGLVGGGVLVANARNNASDARHELAIQTSITEALRHPGSKYFSLGTRGAASGYAIVDGANLYLSVDGLPRNDVKATTYVLWSKGSTGALDAISTFDVTNDKALMLKLPTSKAAAGAAGFAISYESGRVAPDAPTRVSLG